LKRRHCNQPTNLGAGGVEPESGDQPMRNQQRLQDAYEKADTLAIHIRHAVSAGEYERVEAFADQLSRTSKEICRLEHEQRASVAIAS
jgi:hypothetical protein